MEPIAEEEDEEHKSLAIDRDLLEEKRNGRRSHKSATRLSLNEPAIVLYEENDNEI